MKKDITELYCVVDDFCQEYEKYAKEKMLDNAKKRNRLCTMSLSEMLTIMLMLHSSYAKNFKYFYKSDIEYHYKQEFPKLLSYNRFIELMPRLLLPLTILLNCVRGEETGLYFIDSTTIKACHVKRRYQHKVFRGLARSGKSSMGFFYGFKLHIIINNKGEFMAFKITKGNVDDRTFVPELTKKLQGFLCGDKGYIKQILFEELYRGGLKLIHGIRKNMENKLLSLQEKWLLRKRNLIETVFDYLKNKMNLQHTRHRSPFNALVHIASTLVAYSLKKSKPSFKFPSLIPS